MSSFNLSKPALFRRALLAWYQKFKRDLPWRKNTDPYKILVSELMCQQTQIKTVLPYYAKFLKSFPNAKALASAPEEAVLAAWAGLGYYRRARFLQGAAKAVAATGFPETAEGLLALPGVGAYTAAAIGSISFGLPLAVVDGNVIRVLSRVLALELDPKSGEGKLRISEAAQALLDPGQPGDFNQALMEVGALICSPAKPHCGACPLAKLCAAHAAGMEERYPAAQGRGSDQNSQGRGPGHDAEPGAGGPLHPERQGRGPGQDAGLLAFSGNRIEERREA